MKKPTNKEVVELRKKKLTIIEIARIFKVSRQRIYQVLDKEYNVRRRKLSTVALQNA